MDQNVKVLLWRVTGDNKYNWEGLEWNGYQFENALQNVMEGDK